jgi:hypothetical protein
MVSFVSTARVASVASACVMALACAAGDQIGSEEGGESSAGGVLTGAGGGPGSGGGSTTGEVPGGAGGLGGSAPFVQHALWTERIGQLVGTARSPFAPAGLMGTERGVSLPVGSGLAFLFGDSRTTDGADLDADSVAMAELNPPGAELPKLTWLTQPSGRFLQLVVPGVDLGGMNVPVEGVVVGDTTYVFFTTGYSPATGRHTHSVLAHAQGASFGTMTLDHQVPSDKFLHVSVVVDGDQAYVFGSGPYRKSAVYLARVPLATLANRDTWTYYLGGEGDAAQFGGDESSAAVLVPQDSVGELSVRRHPELGLWMMAYNAEGPRGIHLRTAASPAGPWIDSTLIWKPEDGAQHYMHAAQSVVGFDDGLAEPGREEDPGREYGPYLVPEWFDRYPTPEGAFSIVYVLSSGNPYTVHLMRTVLGDPSLADQKPEPGMGFPKPVIDNGVFASGTLDGWSASGDPFGTFVDDEGQTWMTTFSEAEGDDATGSLWQDFTVDAATSELVFRVHGGGGPRVELVDGEDVVRVTRGRNQNAPAIEVHWQLREYRGKTVRLRIVDDQTGPWGFIGATGFELH